MSIKSNKQSSFQKSYKEGREKIVKMKSEGKYKRLEKGNVIGLVIMLIMAVILYYLCIPALSIYSEVFWLILIAVLILICLVTLSWGMTDVYHTKVSKVVMYAAIFATGCVIIGCISSMKLFSSSKYAGLLRVVDGNFETDIVEMDRISDIAIMDTNTAITIGDRAIGSLTDIVSQFVVSEDYSQIDYNGKPMKVAPLEYAGLIKYFNNRSTGIPGYVMVDPVSNEASYVELEKPMKYTPSAYFNEDLRRHLRFQYPAYLFNSYSFELDPEGNPYYVCAVLKANAGFFGARDVRGVVICDPCTGDSQFFNLEDVPNWVDRVYDGDLLTKKYDWFGKLSGGYWNSIFGNKGCKKTTDDYGYKVIDGDVWVYTGVTSVNADESNIGFVLMNERTAEARYYQISGAEEYSAMSSAQGEVQHLGYVASFPSLINIGGEPTYIMAMKDEAGLVKMYALVNVQKYNIVATGSSQQEALASYKKLMKENGISQTSGVEKGEKSKLINIDTIRYVNMNGDTIVYISDTQGNVYKQTFAENEALIFLKEGDRITVYYEESDNQIYNMTAYE